MKLSIKFAKWAHDEDDRPTRYGATVWIGRLGLSLTGQWDYRYETKRHTGGAA